MISDIEIAELLNSKLLHDLAGPIGAVSSSIDFIDEQNSELREKALNLIKDASEKSISKLSYYRIAFGNSKNRFDIELDKLKKLIISYFSNTKVTIEFLLPINIDEISNYKLSNQSAKIILNALLIFSNSIIYGGKIIIELIIPNQIDDFDIGKSDSLNTINSFKIKASSEKSLKLDEIFINLFVNKVLNNQYSSYNIIYLYFYKLLQELDNSYNFTIEENNISFEILY